MKPRSWFEPRNLALIAVIIVGCTGAGWLAIRTTAVRVITGQPTLVALAPDDPDRKLDAAMVNFVMKRGRLSDSDYADIADAARAAPLDARPFLFAASRHIITDDGQPTIPLLEAARRLDPRDSWTRIYLVYAYIRARRYHDASVELAVLNRLVGSAKDGITTELARMSVDPATAEDVRRTLAQDPKLENAVLTKLATSGVSPQLIFGMATPGGRAIAGKSDGWGAALVTSLIARQQYDQAHTIWMRLYAISDTAAATTPYDGDLHGLAGSVPFNWALNADETGATDRGDGGLLISYYGRRTGELANQLLVLKPGRYQLRFVTSGDPVSNGGPTLSWAVGCDLHEQPRLLDATVPNPTPSPRTIIASFEVPAQNCGAQWLRLIGNLGQFPTAITTTIRHVAIQREAVQ